MFNKIKLPYDDATIINAVNEWIENIDEKDLDIINSNISKKLESIYGELFTETSKVEFNRQIAIHNGITIKDLIASPNYERLSAEYGLKIFNDLIEVVTDEGVPDKAAWGMIAIQCDLIK